MEDLKPEEIWESSEVNEVSPFYHRWSYNPRHDIVSIDDDEPFEDRGYAYRINNIWRILDADHQKVKDPHIHKKILDALRGEASHVEKSEDYDFDMLHYGDPVLVNNQEELGNINGIN